MEASGVWMSILDYAQFKKISISSIRRYIKAGLVKNKKENGKFFIYVSQEKLAKGRQESVQETGQSLALELENQRLKQQVRQLQEEVGELQMLVNLYEMGIPPAGGVEKENDLPPALPTQL